MDRKNEIRLDYLKRLNVVTEYIDNNLDKDLSVSKLAEISNFSPFHFHRIFKGFLCEPIGHYIIRTRVEAAAHLIRYTNLEIKNIAFSIGYESPGSLNKIFKQYYNISPTEYKKNKNFAIVRSIIHNSNIKLKPPEIIEITDKQVIYIRITGKYGNVNFQKAWNELWDFVNTNKLISNQIERIGISHDDPKITKNENCRYDACLTIHKAVKPQGKVGVKIIEGGKFAIFNYRGSYTNLDAVYDTIFSDWFTKCNYELRNIPLMEKKMNDPLRTEPDKLKTEIYVPIK
ncbi:MAG: AraC family transcriptional regulator [Bacteroidales bacterium]|nr:AraC family transcriptional regulator [Bacteroidales bacterium]